MGKDKRGYKKQDYYNSQILAYQFKMKLPLLFSCLILVSASSAYNTCGNCQAVVVSFSQHLTTLTSIELQKLSLEWNLCRHMPIEQVSDCYYGVRNYWGALARQFWHGYYDPEASWTCGSVCLAPEDQVLACSECEAGLQLSLQQLSNQEVLDEILSQLEESGFCSGTKNEDLCNAFLPMATYQGLPLLAEGLIPDTWLQDQVCNQAVPGTC